MKALWRNQCGIQNFITLPDPEIQQPDEVKIKVLYAAIGIQDLRMSREWDYYSKPGISGYEMSGVIVALGSEAKQHGFYIGQHVTGTPVIFCGHCANCLSGEEQNCVNITARNGCLCEYIVWKYSQLIPLPESMPFSIGSLAEPVAVVSMAIEKIQIKPGSSICILGGDFNGLVMLQLAKLQGAGEITVVDEKEMNRSLALSLGASHVLDTRDDMLETNLLRLSSFSGYTHVAITSSNPRYLSLSQDIAARGGDILITVYFDIKKDIAINSLKFFSSNLQLKSSFLYSKRILQQAPSLMKDLRLKELITREYSFGEALSAFRTERACLYPRIGINGFPKNNMSLK